MSSVVETPVLLEQIVWAPPLFSKPERNAGLEKAARQALGQVPGWLCWVSDCEWLARACIAAGSLKLAHISVDLAAFAGLVVSQDNSCRYCYGTHRALLKMLGHSDRRIRELEHGLHTAELSPREKAALAFVRQISRAQPRPARAERQALEREGLSPESVAELAYVAAITSFYNRVATMLAIPPDPFETQVDSLMMRVMRPAVAFAIRRRSSAAPPVEAPADGPFPELVGALHASPTARALGEMITLAWASPSLEMRSKALIVTIVGTALDCPCAVPRAQHMLQEYGLGADDLDQIVRNLSSPRLSPVEARLVSFARETVRFRTEALQRRMKDFSAGLPRAQVLDAIGMASLANALCRLSILLA
jgi:AhpD family alkylhydroperoxidase